MAGAPDLKLTDETPAVSMREMSELCDEALTELDKKLMFYFYLYWDCRNIVRLLKNPDAEIELKGNYSKEQYTDLITSARELTFNVHRYPKFLSEFARAYNYNKDKTGYYPEDDIMFLYYQYGMKCPNKMVREWFQLNLNINNILTAMIARQNGWNVSDYVLGNDEVAEMLRNNSTRDFDLTNELDYVTDLMPIVEETDPVQKERRFDVFRWKWLDEYTFFEPFSFESVFAYMCKLQMLERWSQLDTEQGKAKFEQIITDLRGEAKVPDEFKTVSASKKMKEEGQYNKNEK